MENKEPSDPDQKPTGSQEEVTDSEKATNSKNEPPDSAEKRTNSDKELTDSGKNQRKFGSKQTHFDERPADDDQKPSNSENEPADPEEKQVSSDKGLTDSGKKRKKSGKKSTDTDQKPTDSGKKRKKSGKRPTDTDQKPTSPEQEPTDSGNNQKSDKEPIDTDQKLKISDEEVTDSGKKTASPEKDLQDFYEQPTSSDEKSKNLDKISSDSNKKQKSFGKTAPWTQEKIDLDQEPHLLHHIAMVSNTLNRVLDTASSVIAKKNLFTGRHSTYIPDFFFIFFFISLFLGSAVLDRMFTLMIFFNGNYQILGVVYFVCALSPIIYFFFFDESKETFLEQYNLNRFFIVAFRMFIVLFGLDSVYIGRKIFSNMREEIIFWKQSRENYQGNDFYFFHIPDAKHCDVKIYCFMCTVTKSIPQLFLASFYLLMSDSHGVIVFFAFKVMMMNMIIFALTMAITFPIRKSPKVFRTCTSALLNCSTKFLATLCSCGLTLTVFATLFPYIGFKALFLYLTWFIFALFPSFYILKALPHFFPSKVYLVTYAVTLSLIFTFIYIHPFERRGKFFYYYFHFIRILSEIAALYLLTEVDNEIIMVYVSLKALVIGLMGCCLLNNVLHKVDRYKVKRKNFFEPLIL